MADWLRPMDSCNSLTDFSPSIRWQSTISRASLAMALSRPQALPALSCISLKSSWLATTVMARMLPPSGAARQPPQPAKPSAAIFSSYGPATVAPGTRVALTESQSSGLRMISQPSP